MARRDEDVFSSLPSKLVDRLMPFQKEGVVFATRKNGRCLIADEMGLGKTIQAISIAYFYRSEWPLLIIVPSSLRFSWVEELEKWIPDIHPSDIFMVQSGNDASGIQKAQICITTYGLLCKSTSHVILEALNNQKFQVVIVDESHYIRNMKTASCKAIVPLIKGANRKILLSGTPSLAKPVELFPQIDSICPGKFGSWWSYTAKYCDAKTEFIGKIRKRSVDGASNLEELQKKLSDTLMIRRCKDQVLTQLPPKQRQRMLFDLKDSELKKEIKKMFEELKPFLKRRGQDLSKTDDGPGDLMVLSTIQKLYQLSGDAKIGPARDYVDMLCDNQNLKFLVFAYHHAMMNGIQQTLLDRNVKFIRIDGDTKPSERQMYVNQFQSDPETRVAILSILAAGVGLTFTKATLVVFAEMYWTPGVLVQCEDRAHRIGQNSCVSVHYLVAKDTMDEWVWSAVCKKTIVTTATLNGRKQKLEANQGDKYQVDILSNADAYMPSQEEGDTTQDFAAMFASQQPRDQRSILEFWGKGKKRKNSGNSENSPERKKTKTEDVIALSDREDDVCIVDYSDEESEDLKTSNVPKVKKTNTQKIELGADFVEKEYFLGLTPKQIKKCSTSSGKKCSSDSKLILMGKGRAGSAQKSVIKPLESGTSELDAFSEDSVKKNSKTASARRKLNAVNDGSILNAMKGNAKEWSCEVCTFLNHIELPFCEMCSTPKSKNRIGKSNLSQGESDSSKGIENDTSVNRVLEVCSNQEGCTKDNEVIEENEMLDKISGQLDEEVSQSEEKKRNGQEKHCDDNRDSRQTNRDKNDKHNGAVLSESLDSENTTEQVDNEMKSSQSIEWTLSDDESLPGVFANPCRKKSVRKSFQLFSPSTRSTENEDRLLNDEKLDEATCRDDGNRKEDESIDDDEDDGFTEGELGIFNMDDNDFCMDKSQSSSHDSEDSKSVTDTCAETESVSDRLTPEALENKLSKDIRRRRSDSPKGRETEDLHTMFDNEELEEEEEKESQDEDKENVRVVDLDKIPVHKAFNYCFSKYTGRVYLFDQDGNSLEANFLPLDVDLGNQDNLPDLLLHPLNLRIVQKFMREWNSLTETKRRLVMKSGHMFSSLLNAYDQIRSGKTPCIQRHRTKADIAISAVANAEDNNGYVRVISKVKGEGQLTKKLEGDSLPSGGVAQAVSADGIPLCLNCSTPYTNPLLKKSTIRSEESAWATRFCSLKCSDKYWIQTNPQYCRDQVYEAERGICQICKFDAHSFFKKIRDTADLKKRADLIQLSKFSKLTPKQREQMVKHPVSGHFWHVDHIKPVWEGGGQCDIDNFRTLCVICHQKVTADQAKKRATVQKLGQASGMADITAFFQPS